MIRRLWSGIARDPLALLSLVFLLAVMAAGLLAPWLASHDPLLVSWRDKYHGISLNYPLGADHLGSCILSRLLFGIRNTLFVALLAMAVTMLTGTVLGMLAGYLRGRVDAALMRLCDQMLSFPGEVMIFALVGILGTGLQNTLLAVVLVKWAWYVVCPHGARYCTSVQRQTLYPLCSPAGGFSRLFDTAPPATRDGGGTYRAGNNGQRCGYPAAFGAFLSWAGRAAPYPGVGGDAGGSEKT